MDDFPSFEFQEEQPVAIEYRPVHRWSAAAEARLKSMWLAGDPVAEMVSVLGVSERAVYNKAVRLGLPNRTPPRGWPPEDEQELRRHWEDGLSASQISGVMGYSRNAILGKVHRLGLEPRRMAAYALTDSEREVRRVARLKARRAFRALKARVLYEPKARPARAPKPKPIPWAGSRNVPLLELLPNECRYPFGDGPFVFCGQRVMPGESYCGHCYEVAHAPRGMQCSAE